MKKLMSFVFSLFLILGLSSCNPASTNQEPNTQTGSGDYSILEGAWEYVSEASSSDIYYKAYFDNDQVLYIYGRDISDTLFLEKKMSVSSVTAEAFQYSSLLKEGSCAYTMENDQLVLVWDNDSNETYTLNKITETVPLGIKFYLENENNPSLSSDIEGRNWWTQAGYSFFVLPQSVNLNGLKPTIELTNGATVTPGSLVSQNLSSPVSYSFSKNGVTKTQTLVAFQPDEDSNMLINGDFAYGSLFWDVWNTPEDGGAEVNMDVVDGAVHLEFDGTAQSTWWYNGFDTTLEGTTLIQDALYKLSVDAWGSDRPFCLYLNEHNRDLNNDGNNYSNYIYIRRPIEVTRKTYNYYFTMMNPDDDQPTIGVLLSDSVGEVFLDNFSLTRITDVEDLIEPITLNSAVEGYLAYPNQLLFYSVPVSPSTSYTIVWNDYSDGDGTMQGDVKVSVFDQNDMTFVYEKDSGYTTPFSFTTDAATSELIIRIDSVYESSVRSGSFVFMLSSN